MTEKERQSTLYKLNGVLHVLCAAVNPEHNRHFTDASATAQEQALEAYKLTQILLGHMEFDKELVPDLPGRKG